MARAARRAWVAKLGRRWGVLAMVVVCLTGAARGARAQAGGVSGGLPPPSAAGVTPEAVVRVRVPPPQQAPRPFLMGLEFLTVLEEDGDLAHPGQNAQSIGLRFIFREGRALRQHLAFAHHWEEQSNVTRRGFRLDLLSIGFPI